MSWRCVGGRVALVAAAGLLAACATQPLPAIDAAVAPDALLPLAPQPALPAGAAPHSQVPSVRYDLAVSGAGELTDDDGVPGDGAPRSIFERGGASWYGIQFHQRKTANGERFDMSAMTAAHKTLPFNTRVCVRSLVNGREVLVRVNDRGPYAAGRIIDLSRAAADALDMLGVGIKQVALSIVDGHTTRCGDALVAAAVEAVAPAIAPVAKKPSDARVRVVPPRERR
ncbi:MAG: septal ring lytic transglycosylase RlpA family protein [Variovorax sp.]